ncbi:hypothetical protein V8Z79_03395 [Pantoea dispersa]
MYAYAPNAFSWIDPLGLSKCSGDGRSDPYKSAKDASAYLRSMGVNNAQRKQIIDSFDLDTLSVQKAGSNQFGTRFHDYGKTARAECQYFFKHLHLRRTGLVWHYLMNGMV